MEYLYSVIRFVPNPTLGEFINVGIIAGNDDTRDWSVQWLHDMRRAKTLDDALGANMYPVLERYRARIEEYVSSVRKPHLDLTIDYTEPQVNHEWLTQMHLSTNDVIQFTKPLPVFSESSQQAIGIVQNLLLFEPEPATRSQPRERLFGELERSLTETIIQPEWTYQRRAILRAGDIVVPSASRSSLATFSRDKVHVTFVFSFNGPQDRHDRELTAVTSSLWFAGYCRKRPLVVSDRNENCLYAGKQPPRFAALVEAPESGTDQSAYAQAKLSIAASKIDQYDSGSLEKLCAAVGATVA